MDEFLEAKEIYFCYLGSRFNMSRDGAIGEIEAKFDSYRVPAMLLEQWAAQLKDSQLKMLDSPGNWAVIHFLRHRGYAEHPGDLVATPPRGRLWQRCAYLEGLLGYLDACADDRYGFGAGPITIHEPDFLWAAIEHVIDEARKLLRVARSAASVARVNSIIVGARKRLAACTDANGPKDRPMEV